MDDPNNSRAESTATRSKLKTGSISALERAKAGAAALNSPERNGRLASDQQSRNARAPSSPTPNSSGKLAATATVGSTNTSDTEESDSDEEDIFVKMSTAFTRASNTLSHASAHGGMASPKRSSMPGTKKKDVKQRLKPRTRLVLVFLAFECLMLGLGALVAKTLEQGIFRVEVSSTAATLMITQSLYFAKVTRLASTFAQMANETLFQNYIENRDPSFSAEIRFRLMEEVTSRDIEFSTLLDADMKIVESANLQRQGELFDPSGVVTVMQSNLASGLRQVSIGAQLTYTELIAEMPPEWKEGADASAPTLSGLHPYETEGNSFIRYVVTAIMSSSDPTKLVGYFLAGDILNGKMAIPGNVYLALWGSSSPKVSDGFIGIYMHDNNSTDGWNVCSHATMATIKGLNARALSLDVDVTSRRLLGDALAANGTYEVASDINEAYVFVAQKPPDISATLAGDQGDPPIVLVQATNSKYWKDAFKLSMSLLAVVFAIDTCAVWIASLLFLGPLELLGNRIRKGRELNLKMVESLKRRKHLIYPVLCVPLASFGFSIYCLTWATTYMENARIHASVKKTSAIHVAYTSKHDQIRTGFMGLAAYSEVMTMASGVNVTAADILEVQSQLTTRRDARKMQYSILVDVNKKILYDPNGDEFIGQVFDPRKLVSSALNKGYPVSAAVTLTYEEFAREKAPRFADSLSPDTPPSQLYPYDQPQNDVLVRFAVVPVSITNSAGGTEIVGALIAGDVANGINLIPETANELLNQEGYSAIYIVPNSDELIIGATAGFQLVSSALRENKKTIAVDLEIDGIMPILLYAHTHPMEISTGILQISGESHFFTARCAPEDYTYKPEGRLFVSRKEGEDCMFLLVQSARGTATNYLAQRVLMASIGLLLAQIMKLLVLEFLLLKAFVPFKRIILGQRPGPPLKERIRTYMRTARNFRLGRKYGALATDPGATALLQH